MLVLVAVSLIILLVAAAFSVDVAFMQLSRQELHIATDAAAKAAAASLAQGGSPGQAKNAAVDCAAANTVGGKPLSINAGNIDFGQVAYTALGRWEFVRDATPLCAARVSVDMSQGTHAGPIHLFFGRLLGTSTFNPYATSTAACVRNKVCFCFDRSRSMTFDLSGNEEQWPSGNGWPNGVPAGLPILKKQLYPPCNGSRWSSLCSAANLFLDVLGHSSVPTPVALITWSEATSYTAYYQEGTYYNGACAFEAVDTDSLFLTEHAALRTALDARGSKTMLGRTNMSAGLQRAIELFNATDDGTPWNKIIILFSDGLWNVGSDPLVMAQTAADAKIVVHTVGLLNGADNGAMRTISTITGGMYFYAPDGASLQSAFEQLARTLPVILTE
jgi:Flp pilus assembly protein TadG